ncbi:DNA mismatch repair endonuclease MutL [Clostridium transplantifaecale]|uniref:DNA mismatch repair endonuclease MutL n=1 Tax=Clostridium transplantifaecale TaxID=2479838 RepID=UPI000F634AFE|nr:DNA mismatch repair endonuclease MutL [Clostridium transplantifaecale]
MANIQVLDQNTINQIAAGEVIERPASVVKELLENAVDAKATAVTVEIRDGGLSMIRVTDNGCGIPKEQIPLAFLRHATSKIRTVEDLFTVASLGFRGEALSSIASVAQVELITKTTGSMSGSRYQIEGGEEISLEEVGAPEGTTFIARNLFYNTPARRKFLKTPMTEGAHVADLVEKIALSHPEISIRLIQNGQSKLHTSGNHNLKDIVYTIFGREIAANLLPVESGADPVKVEGYIGKPLIARGNRNYENYFINGRYIKSSLINKAIEDAYKPFMMQHKYPFTMLQFTIEPEFLDVNVHPAKMELRFRDGEMVYKMVYHTISMALSQKELIPQVELPGVNPFGGKNAENQETGKDRGIGGSYGNGRTQDGMPYGVPSSRGLKPVIFRENRPEPFEKRRLQAESLIQSAAASDLTSAHEAAASEQAAPEAGGRPSGSSGLTGKDIRDLLSVRTPVIADETAPYSGRPDAPVSFSAAKPDTGIESEHGIGPEQNIDPEPNTGSDSPSDLRPEAETAAADTLSQAAPKQLDLFEEKLLTKQARSEHILIGQLFDTYWLVQFHDNLYIIDQHAAHEKVLYEKTIASLKKREYTSQLINPPIILTLSGNEELMLKKYMDHFTSVGFEIEHFGGKEYAVRAVPANLFSIAKRELLMEMIDGLTDGVDQGTPDIINEKIASMSCKAAVKGNHAMSAMEADKLIDELLELENPYACPHGRPTIITMSKYELEKKFKRIV